MKLDANTVRTALLVLSLVLNGLGFGGVIPNHQAITNPQPVCPPAVVAPAAE